MQPDKLIRWLTAVVLFAAAMVFSPAAALSQPRPPGPPPPAAAAARNEAGELRKQAGKLYTERKYDEAVRILERALALLERSAGKNDRDVASVLSDLGQNLVEQGKAKEAEKLYLRAIGIVEKALGPEHVDVAYELEGLSIVYRVAGNLDQAIAVAKRSLSIREKALGPGHRHTLEATRLLAAHYEAKREHPQAIVLYERVAAIQKKKDPPAGPMDNARAVADLAEAHHKSGDTARAILMYEELVAVLEKELGATDGNVAGLLTHISDLYLEMGDAKRAVMLVERALLLREQRLGKEHLDVAVTLNRLAAACRDAGDYDRAAAAARRALGLFEKALGPNHLDIAPSLNDLAKIELDRGDYARAEALFMRSLDLFSKALGPEHKQVGVVLNNLASVYYAKGDFQRALEAYQKALQIREKALGPDHSDVAAALGNVAEVHLRLGNAKAAEPLFLRAVSIREKALGPEHPLTGRSVHNLGSLYLEQGDAARAEPLLLRALSIREKALGPSHPELAPMIINLASVRQQRGDFDQAERLLRRALDIQEKSLGPDHPAVAVTLHNLALLLETRGISIQVIDTFARANEISERHLALVLATGSEAQKLAYLATLGALTDTTVSLHLRDAKENPAAARLALLTILRRKGRVLDAMAESIGTLRARLSPSDQKLLDELATARSALANAVLRGPGPQGAAEHRRAIDALKQDAQALEQAISARSTEFRVQSEPVVLEKVQAAIPEGAALVEMFAYHPFDPKAPLHHGFGKARYAAYVLFRSGAPAAVDLGEAAPIDAQVKALRKALSDPRRQDTAALGRALDESLMRPIRTLTKGARMLAISPDGALNLVPFAALTGEDHRYLIEHTLFVYLTSGRDLLRLVLGGPSRQGAVIMADPNFDATGTAEAARGTGDDKPVGGRRAVGLSRLAQMQFSPLPGTAQEADALRNVLSGTTVLTQASATKQALSKVKGPKILHVATHGFFLADQDNRLLGGRGLVLDPSSATAAPGIALDNPLLRSGIALAGANGQDKAAGILTALEASGLDLHHTKLVVLSACETGIGDVTRGDGVYGLRRALVMAGAETQVMSLWKVDDAATRDLMVDYYRDIQAGHGRAEAMRRVQLQMLSRKEMAHPFYWAAFIVSGNPAPLSEGASRVVAPVAPGARGCACEAGRARDQSMDGAVWMAAFTLLVRRRWRTRGCYRTETSRRAGMLEVDRRTHLVKGSLVPGGDILILFAGRVRGIEHTGGNGGAGGDGSTEGASRVHDNRPRLAERPPANDVSGDLIVVELLQDRVEHLGEDGLPLDEIEQALFLHVVLQPSEDGSPVGFEAMYAEGVGRLEELGADGRGAAHCLQRDPMLQERSHEQHLDEVKEAQSHLSVHDGKVPPEERQGTPGASRLIAERVTVHPAPHTGRMELQQGRGVRDAVEPGTEQLGGGGGRHD